LFGGLYLSNKLLIIVDLPLPLLPMNKNALLFILKPAE